MTGIVDVAARAGVSVATVSRALRGLPGVSSSTRETVRAIAAELGYVASPSAAALPTGRTRAVGVVSPVARGWYFTAVAEGVQDVLAAAGYDVLRFGLSDVETDRRRVFDTQLLRKRVDALIVLSLPIIPEELAALRAIGRPVVVVGPVRAGLTSVRIDDVDVGRIATSHLVGLGHRQIAFIGGDPGDRLGFPVAPDRIQGYEEILRVAGVRPDLALVVPAKFTAEAGAAAFGELLERGPLPTAAVAASDEIAMGFIYAARAVGVRIPQDISVVGVDDHDMSWLFDLTTVAQPVREQGRIAARLVIERLRAQVEVAPEVVTIPTRLRIRASTAAPTRT